MNINHQTFLEEFFGPGNQLQWEAYDSGTMPANAKSALKPWIDKIATEAHPFFLPRVDPNSKITTWYAFCNDTRTARGLRELLTAFIGATYSQFDGQFAELDENDLIESACQREFGNLVFKLPVVDSQDRPVVEMKLKLLSAFNERTPNRSVLTPKPIGRLLRDLEMAVVVRNEQSAWKLYEEIRSRGRLSSSNLAFLQVTIYAAFERWQDILSLPQLNDLLNVIRPKRVTEAISSAVYQIHLACFESTLDVEGVVAQYQGLNSKYAPIFRTISGITGTDSLKAALIASVASEPPRHDQAKVIASCSALNEFKVWCDALLGSVAKPKPTTLAVEEGVSLAEASYANGDFDNAFPIFLDCEHTLESVRRVLEIAIEINTLDAASSAVKYFESASKSIQDSIESRRNCRNQLDNLKELLQQNKRGQTTAIASWPEWFNTVDGGGELDRAVEIAKLHSAEWDCGAILDSAASVTEMADLISKGRTEKPHECVRNALPHLIDSFLTQNTPSRTGKPIYLALTEILAYDDSIGPDDLTAVEQLIEAVLTSAPSHEKGKNDYQNSASFVNSLWMDHSSARILDWALGMLDLLIDSGAANHSNLEELFSNVVDKIRPWKRRVNDEQWSLLEFLGQDLGLTNYLDGIKPVKPEVEETAEVEIGELLDGKSIAVFSLTERIAKRFGQMAKAMFNGIKIHYLHDKFLTDRMKSLSQSADIFIVNTWDAKHAATIGIKDNRPKLAVTLEPEGKSATSLLHCLKQYTETLAGD
ncbi:protein DpdD [Mariniblastus sp.]|nr:protein DpdD [Mariniblastus sp.]